MKLKIFSLILVLLAAAFAWQREAAFRGASHQNSVELEKIEKGADSFKFAVFGDSRNSVDVYHRVIDEVNASGAIFSIHNGDLVYEPAPYRFKYAIDDLERLKAPVLVIPGNHDFDHGDAKRSAFAERFGASEFSFRVGKATFIALDNNSGAPDEVGFARFAGELEKARGKGPILVFMHYPLHDPRASEKDMPSRSGKMERLEKLMADAGVTAVFTGHAHGYWEGRWSGVPFVVTGGAGANLKGTDAASNVHNWVLVTVEGDKVSWRVEKLTPPGWRGLDETLYDLFVISEGYLHRLFLAISVIFSVALWVRVNPRGS